MKREEIDEILNGENNEVLQAHKEIVELQRGKSNIIKTGYTHLDFFLVGGLQNKMVFIGSRPSQGKTHNCETVIKNLFDPSINPNQNISLLRLNLEMQTKSLLLRDLKRSLGKKMRDIISFPYTEEEKEKVKEVVNRHKNPRITNFSHAVNENDLRYLISEFIKKSNSRFGEDVQKIILVDHIHIYQSKKEIDEVLKIFNEFKLQDSNLSFIIYFQLARTLEDVWRDSKEKKANPKNFLPHSGFIYNSDSLYQLADLVMTMVIPQVVDLEEFAVVYKERNQHLSPHFIPGSEDNVTVRLKGRNRIYYNYIKIRLTDDFEDPRLYADILNEEYEKNISNYSSPSSTPLPVFSTPTENFKFNSPALNRFGKTDLDEEPPF